MLAECSNCGKRCKGFFTDREQRKVWGMGILYVLGFPILLLMIVVGSLKATPPGEENPICPAEPNMPWFLITGGVGIAFLLLVRIVLTKVMRCIKNNQDCCDDVAGCFCEFGCNLIYDIIVMVMIVMWMITVSWWVFRHRIGPENLYSILGKEKLDNFRASLGDNETIHDIQFTDPQASSYCDHFLYMLAFVLLSLGWIVLTGALIVFIADKIFNKLVCCRLCRNITHKDISQDDEEQIKLEGQPKRPMTAYFLWMNEEGRAMVKGKNPKASITEVAKKCGEEWREMDGTAKAKFERMNKEAKEKYDGDYKEWLEDGGEELLKQQKKEAKSAKAKSAAKAKAKKKAAKESSEDEVSEDEDSD